MSKCEMLRLLVKQRLTAAAEEIFGLFERSIAEYEEELSRSKEENERQQKLLDAVFNPQLHLHRIGTGKEEVPPEQQEWSSDVDQEDPEPPEIKEEQEELWIGQEGQQLQGQEEDITEVQFTPVALKSEDDEEKPQTSQLHQRQTEQMETDGEDCGGPEPSRRLQPDNKTDESPEPETDDSDEDWTENTTFHSDLNFLKNDDVPVSDLGRSSAEKPFSCSDCGKRFGQKGHLKSHMRCHTGEKPFNCSICRKSFTHSGNLQKHMIIHTGEKPFKCSLCGKRFSLKQTSVRHMRTHTGEKPFSCSFCDKKFAWSHQVRHHRCSDRLSSQPHQKDTDDEDFGGPEPAINSDLDAHLQPETDDSNESGLNHENPVSDSRFSAGQKSFSCSTCGKRFDRKTLLKRHMTTHTGEKRFSCSICEKSFRQSGHLHTHMKSHTGEKPFGCSECGKRFGRKTILKQHVLSHRGEKPFSCSVCKSSFTQSGHLQKHMRIHTGEKPFSCSECARIFGTRTGLKRHMRTHTGEKPFDCSVCGRSFSHKQTLVRHMRTHTREKPLSPSVWKSFLTQSGLLKTETVIRSGEDCIGPEADRKSNSDTHRQPGTDDSDEILIRVI